jgi:hypothetical protein
MPFIYPDGEEPEHYFLKEMGCLSAVLALAAVVLLLLTRWS